MNRFRYLGLVALLLLALVGPPAAYLWAQHIASRSQNHAVCKAVNEANANIVKTWNYLEDRVHKTRPPDAANALDVLEHLKTFAPQGVCR